MAKSKLVPIEITPEYLPEGYAEFEEGKYSLNGEWGGDGSTIVDAGYCKSYSVPDVNDYEELEIEFTFIKGKRTPGNNLQTHTIDDNKKK